MKSLTEKLEGFPNGNKIAEALGELQRQLEIVCQQGKGSVNVIAVVNIASPSGEVSIGIVQGIVLGDPMAIMAAADGAAQQTEDFVLDQIRQKAGGEV